MRELRFGAYDKGDGKRQKTNIHIVVEDDGSCLFIERYEHNQRRAFPNAAALEEFLSRWCGYRHCCLSRLED